jgi:hypothetical protein
MKEKKAKNPNPRKMGRYIRAMGMSMAGLTVLVLMLV